MNAFETSLASFFFDEQNVLHAVSKDVPITYERLADTISTVRSKTGNQRVCVLAGATYARQMDKQTSEMLTREFGGICKAIAIISKSKFGTMTINAYFHFYPPAFPVKMFSNEPAALAWLKQYA